MNILNKIITVAATVAALSYFGSNSNTIYRYSEDVNFKTTDGILSSLDEAERFIWVDETFTLVITSPGGVLMAYKDVMNRFNSTELKTITRVNNYAASAGALMFLLGDEREMREGSELIYHNARYIIKGVHVTADLLRKYLEDPSGLSNKILEAISVLGDDIEAHIESLDVNNLKMFKSIEDKFGKEVASKLLISGKDVIVTPKEALEMGIATKILKTVRTRL